MDQTRAYEILGLSAGATRFEVRQAYRDLLHVWQPDRVGKNLRLQKRAKEQVAQITEAYELLEASLPRGQDATADEAPALLPESDEIGEKLGRLTKAYLPETEAGLPAVGGNPLPEPVLDMSYVPDGPPAPKTPLAARLRETRAEMKQQVAKGVATAIPFRRRNVILACLAVVVIPVSAFYGLQYLRENPGHEKDTHETVSKPPHGREAVTEPTAIDPATVPAAVDAGATANGPPVPATIAAAPMAATEPATRPVNIDPAVLPVAGGGQPAGEVDPRIALIAELRGLGVTPPADSTAEQLAALLVRARLARELAAAGFKLDPLKVSLEMMNQYQVRADLAAQINKLAGTTILANEYSLSELRDMRVSAGIVAKIAENGSKVDMKLYTRTELADMLHRSEVAHELQTKYGVSVDITVHPVEELELMLKHAQDQRAATRP